MPVAGVYTIETTIKCVMSKTETIITNIVIQAIKMDDTIKRQEIIIDQLKSEKKELISIIEMMKRTLYDYAPEIVRRLEAFNL